MNFDLEQTLDFVKKRYSKRLTTYYGNRNRKRRFSYEQASVNNELSDIVSSFTLTIDSKAILTTNIENNCLLEESIEQDIMDQDNLDNVSQIENSNTNENEMINSSCDSLDLSNDFVFDDKKLLHYYRNI